ncbi:MAG: EamA family transporter [Verrucomicrobia bacterium]|nr:EamA family transporter [Verrucomicrobiota bacterium]
MSAIEVAAALLVALVWGVQFVTSKYGVDAFPPLLFLTLRFATVALLLLPFAGRSTRREIGAAAVISVFFGGLCFGLFFVGLHLGLAGLSSVIVQLMTPFTVLFAWPLLGERPPLRVIIGVVVAFAGVALALAGPGEPVSAVAVLLVMGGAASQALGNVLIKRFGPFQPIRFMAWLSLFTVPQAGLASAVFETGQETALRKANVLAWLSLGYGVLFGAVIGFGLWFWLIGRCSLARVAPFALLSTVFAIGAGILVLHEKVSSPLLAGALICIAGVVLTQAGANSDKTTVPRSSLCKAGEYE